MKFFCAVESRCILDFYVTQCGLIKLPSPALCLRVGIVEAFLRRNQCNSLKKSDIFDFIQICLLEFYSNSSSSHKDSASES